MSRLRWEPRGAQEGVGSSRLHLLLPENAARDLPQEMRGDEGWEEKGFICSSRASVIAGSHAVLRGTSKKPLPKKDILALVSVAEGSRRCPDKEDDKGILGQTHGDQGSRWQRRGGGADGGPRLLLGAAAGIGASAWVDFVPRRPVLFRVPRKQGLRLRPECYFLRVCSPGSRSWGGLFRWQVGTHE